MRERWIDRVFTGHVTVGPLTVYGANAMHWAVNLRTRWGYLCAHPTTRTFGGHCALSVGERRRPDAMSTLCTLCNSYPCPGCTGAVIDENVRLRARVRDLESTLLSEEERRKLTGDALYAEGQEAALRAALIEIRDGYMLHCTWTNDDGRGPYTCAERGEKDLCAYCIAVKVIGRKDAEQETAR